MAKFLNHDISAPVGGLLQNLGQVDPVGIVGTVDPAGLGKGWRADVATILQHFANEHARPLCLASLYGDGPTSHDPEVKALYQPDERRFLLGQTSVATRDELEAQTPEPDTVFHATGAPDIPRRDRTPLIADRRNDSNLILSQLHLAFMPCHNKAVAELAARGTPGAEVFATMRQLVTLHYHWLVLNDVLPALLSKTVLARPLAQWQPRPLPAGTVPMEFTTAAFRFGHSMVGRAYDFNANFGQGGRISTAGASLLQLFAFTSQGNMEDPRGPPRQLPDHWVIDWDRLTRNQAPDAGPDPVSGKAERFDLDFAPDMLNVAGDAQVVEHGSILFRNLLRGFHRRIPFGQHLAREYGVTLLSRAALRAAMPQHRSPSGDFPDPATAAAALGLLEETPAWLYFLCEAQVIEGGSRVGPTASRIIADTIVSLMGHDPSSVLRHKGGGWHPRDSLLKDHSGQPLDTIRRFLLFASDHTAAV